MLQSSFFGDFGAAKKAPAKRLVLPKGKAAPLPLKRLAPKKVIVPSVRPTNPAANRAPRARIQYMQAALKTLGSKVGDKVLTGIAADGIIGPKTATAVNKAITSYGIKAPKRLYTVGDLLDAAVVEEIAKAVSDKAATVAKPVPAASAKPTKSPTMQRLQQAVVALGKKVKDAALVISADGIVGPKTVAAVNKALRVYATTADPAVRTGRLLAAEIQMNAEKFAQAVETALTTRGAAVPKKPADAPKGSTLRSPAISQIQQNLGQLGALVKDAGLVVTVDGINGPKTAAAVNRALQKYANGAPASLRTGKLSTAQVTAQASSIVDALGKAIATRGATPIPAQTPPSEAEPVTTPDSDETAPPGPVAKAVPPSSLPQGTVPPPGTIAPGSPDGDEGGFAPPPGAFPGGGGSPTATAPGSKMPITPGTFVPGAGGEMTTTPNTAVPGMTPGMIPGDGMPPGGDGTAPYQDVPGAAPAKTNWLLWGGIATGVVALGTAFVLTRKKNASSKSYGRKPSRRARSAMAGYRF